MGESRRFIELLYKFIASGIPSKHPFVNFIEFSFHVSDPLSIRRLQ